MEPSLTKDILMLTPIQKPALLRQLMELGSYYSGQIMPFEHMLGQLSDAGNTTTLGPYLDLLRQSGLLAGLQKYSGAGSASALPVLSSRSSTMHCCHQGIQLILPEQRKMARSGVVLWNLL